MLTAQPTVATVSVERRQSERLEVLGEISGQLLPSALPVVLLDMSPGGFAISSSVPFTPSKDYTFLFRGRRQHGPIRATDMHCLRVSDATGSASYVAGFSFVLDALEQKALADDLFAEAQDLMGLAGS